MDKTELYRKLDIDTIDEFRYYENLASLLEDDDFIDENLIKDLIKDVDKTVLAEHMDSFFEQFLNNLPDDETELYITVDSIGRAVTGMISEKMTTEDIALLADELSRFRKWYVHDLNAFNRIKVEPVSIRDARYDILAAGFLGEKYDFDFRRALDYTVEGYDVRITDLDLE
jgi:hypothetical protein